MSDRAIADTTPFQRLVLLAVVDLATDGVAPVRSYDVRRACESHAGALADVPFGGTSRQEVINALNELCEAGLLAEDEVQSPVGKWRPAYSLTVDPSTVLDALADDEQIGAVVDRVRPA